jgi:phosphoesterase RecJ-like protein
MKPFKKEYQRIYKAILKFNRIIVFRHQIPDFDALGTQMGLVSWLKDNFPTKEIHFVGDDHVTFTPRLYPFMEILEDSWFSQPFLSIIVDTGNKERISDNRWEKASLKIKIDHHPDVEPFGDISIVNTTMAACSELVASIIYFFPGKRILSKTTASFLFAALAGDSGRFMYSSTTGHTFEIAKLLVETGIHLSKDVYQKMYQKSVEDLKVTAYVLGNFKMSPHGIAYYVLPDSVQKDLSITVERGKENINIFANIEGINAWCSISEDLKDNVWRISIRSKEKPVNEVARIYGGGGHAQASGAKIKTLDELPKFIEALDNLFS